MSLTPTTQLMTDRATKGAAYVTAVNAFWAAWVELWACDLALGFGSSKRSGTWPDAATMLHGDFLTSLSAENGNWSTAANARAAEIISDGFIIEPEA